MAKTPFPTVSEKETALARGMVCWGRVPVLSLIEEVPIAELAATQDEVSGPLVRDYMRLLADGEDLGPIDVARIDGRYVIVNGHHRAVAAHRAERRSILAGVRCPTQAPPQDSDATESRSEKGEPK